MNRAEYIAQIGAYRNEALAWFGNRTRVVDGKFKAVIGGIEYPLEVVGVDVGNRTFIGQSLKTEAAIEKGMLVHFNHNSMSLVPL